MQNIRQRTPAEPMTPINDNSAQPDKPVLQVQQPGIGKILREARESTSQSVAQIAARLRIRPEYIQALEDEHPAGIPGRVYAIGFLRTYATYLDLDPLDLIRQYKSTTDADPLPSELNFPKPATTRRQSPELPIIAVSVMVGAAVLYGWYYFGSAGNPLAVNISVQEAPSLTSSPSAALLPAVIDHARTDRTLPPADHIDAGDFGKEPQTAAAPEDLGDASRPTPAADPQPPLTAVTHAQLPSPVEIPRRPEPAVTPQRQAAESNGDEPVTVAAVDQPATEPPAESVARSAPQTGDVSPATQSPTTVPDAEPRPVAALPAPPVPPSRFDQSLTPSPETASRPANAPSPREFGQTNRASRILLTAKTPIWVQVRGPGGADIFTRMLNAGESYRVPNRPHLRLLTGNAGALDVFVDGNQAPALGDHGVILRDLELDPDRLVGSTAQSTR